MHIIALDIGTTGVRAIAYDAEMKSGKSAYKALEQNYPKQGFVEQDPTQISDYSIAVLQDVIGAVGIDTVKAITITNQRESTVLWDKKTGKALHPVISWQCTRTAQRCARLTESEKVMIRQKTGLIAGAYFSASKMEWLFNTYPDAYTQAQNGDLLAGTLDTYIIWVLSDKMRHVTDVSNASRTMLFNIHTLAFDTTLLSLFNIPINCLPTVLDSDAHFADTSPDLFGKSIPIHAVMGDQQAALFAQCGEDTTRVKNTYGTGLFVMACTGKNISTTASLISTIAWRRKGSTHYAVEGSIFTGGSLIQWLRDDLRLIQSATETAEIAENLSDADMKNIFMVPAFSGLGAPYWDSSASGMIIGLDRGSTRAHFVRAALEALAFQSADVVAAIEQTILALRVDGGASENDFLMQFQADVLGIAVEKPDCADATALGVALMAGIKLGVIDEATFRKSQLTSKTFSPSDLSPLRKDRLMRWHAAVKRSQAWKEDTQ